MNKMMEFFSEYDFFNNIIPGVAFTSIIYYWCGIKLFSGMWYADVFLVYFYGLVISRVGSLILEGVVITHILNYGQRQFIKKHTYCQYLSACKKDGKIEVLNNKATMFRTISTMGLLLAFFILYANSELRIEISLAILKMLSLFALSILFLFAYRKQSNYIYERVENCNMLIK